MRILLDTNAVLYLPGGRLASPLPEVECIVSVITEMELLSYPALSDTEADQIRGFLREVEVVGLTEAVKTRAILLRRTCGIKLPDAIVAATAITSDAEICTNDRRLSTVPGLVTRPVALRTH